MSYDPICPYYGRWLRRHHEFMLSVRMNHSSRMSMKSKVYFDVRGLACSLPRFWRNALVIARKEARVKCGMMIHATV